MRTWLPIITGVALAACGREPSPPAPSPTATPPAAAPAAHTATMARLDKLAASSDPVSAESMKSIGGRLQYEAAHRPTAAAPRAEDVLVALQRAGIELAEQRQYVAMTVKAAYCVGGQTADGLSIAVCEYASPADATAGRDFVTERFRIPSLERVIHVRGATTLALGHASDAPLGTTTRRAAAAFQTM